MLSWVELDAGRFRENISAFRKITAPETSVMVVVKANAYGHGLRELASIAAKSGDWLGVNSVDEAQVIHSLGIRKPVAILGYSESDAANVIVNNDYRQV